MNGERKIRDDAANYYECEHISMGIEMLCCCNYHLSSMRSLLNVSHSKYTTNKIKHLKHLCVGMSLCPPSPRPLHLQCNEEAFLILLFFINSCERRMCKRNGLFPMRASRMGAVLQRVCQDAGTHVDCNALIHCIDFISIVFDCPL